MRSPRRGARCARAPSRHARRRQPAPIRPSSRARARIASTSSELARRGLDEVHRLVPEPLVGVRDEGRRTRAWPVADGGLGAAQRERPRHALEEPVQALRRRRRPHPPRAGSAAGSGSRRPRRSAPNAAAASTSSRSFDRSAATTASWAAWRVTVRIVPSTGLTTAPYARSAPSRSAFARSSALNRRRPASPSEMPRKIWDVMTPELPRAPISAPNAIAAATRSTVSSARSASWRALRTVASMFEPVSPSGTGKTFRALTSSTLRSRFSTAARKAARRAGPSQVRRVTADARRRTGWSAGRRRASVVSGTTSSAASPACSNAGGPAGAASSDAAWRAIIGSTLSPLTWTTRRSRSRPTARRTAYRTAESNWRATSAIGSPRATVSIQVDRDAVADRHVDAARWNADRAECAPQSAPVAEIDDAIAADDGRAHDVGQGAPADERSTGNG